MLTSVYFEFDKGNIWFETAYNTRSYEVRITNTSGVEVLLDFNNKQLKELLEKFIDDGLFEVDEDGKLNIVNL